MIQSTCTLLTSAVLKSEIKIDWSNVKPITHYPEFWLTKKIRQPEHYFENIAENENITNYVSNGNLAGRHDYPFKSALISQMTFGDALCGASLISRWAVLTAASCIDGSASSIIILGASDIGNPEEPFQARIEVQSTNYRIHPLYSRGVTNSDIGIVRFDFAIHVFTQAVNRINLPTPAMMNEVFAGLETLTMGFGKSTDVAVNYQYNLHFVALSTMTNTACGIRLPLRIDTSHICTSGILRRGFCEGDVGAPLVLVQGGISYQIGIASLFPRSGCMTGEPSVFTRVTSFMAFIEQHM